MAPDQPAPVPAGWYPDPYATSELRWWDGVNWTDSVHPPAAPEPPAAAPVAPPAVPQPPEPEPQPEPAPEPELELIPPVIEQPSAPQEPIAPAQPASETAPAPQEPEPAPQSMPVGPPPVAAPAPLVEPAPAADASSPVGPLPSRRELRARTATPDGDHSGPAGAAAMTMPPPAPLPDSSAPSAFDWLPGGAALGAGVPAAPPPAAAGEPPSASEPATPPESVSSGPVSASTAWAQEPASQAVDDLYSTAATRKATISGWFIAVMPLLAGILSVAAVKGAENYPRYLPFEWWILVAGVLVILYLVTLLLAVADRSKLDWAGYNRPAHWAWGLLTAPAYLLVRTIAVKRETGRTSALLWVWLVLAAALVGAWFAADYFMPELLTAYTLPFL